MISGPHWVTLVNLSPHLSILVDQLPTLVDFSPLLSTSDNFGPYGAKRCGTLVWPYKYEHFMDY